MKFTFLWTVLLIALPMAGEELLAAKKKRYNHTKSHSLTRKEKAEPKVQEANAPARKKNVAGKKKQQRVTEPVGTVDGAKNRQALINKHRAEVRAMMKKSAKMRKVPQAKNVQKRAKFNRVNKSLRPGVRKRHSSKAYSIANEISQAPKYARFIPDPEFGQSHRVSLTAAENRRKSMAGGREATQAGLHAKKPQKQHKAADYKPHSRSEAQSGKHHASPHRNEFLKDADQHQGMS